MLKIQLRLKRPLNWIWLKSLFKVCVMSFRNFSWVSSHSETRFKSKKRLFQSLWMYSISFLGIEYMDVALREVVILVAHIWKKTTWPTKKLNPQLNCILSTFFWPYFGRNFPLFEMHWPDKSIKLMLQQFPIGSCYVVIITMKIFKFM